MKTLKWIGVLLFVGLAALGLYTWKLSQPIFDEELDERKMMQAVRIAPLDQALTLAKLVSGEVVLVVAASSTGISGLVLRDNSGQFFTDSLQAFNELGESGLRGIGATGRNTQSFDWAQLDIPFSETYPHIAAGTNYRAHADEVGHEGDPFVFPKLSKITRWNADVTLGARLDYELELCAVPLTNHTAQRSSRFGFILCGDYTDRWLLIKEMDIGAPMGPSGFPAGKGGDSRFPVGNLLVIPVSVEFYKEIELKLFLNGQLRQETLAGLMIWSPKKVMNAALEACELPYYLYDTVTAVTPSCEEVPAGTVLLTGTPGGVMFNIATLWSPFSYLREGDEVVSTGTYLGFMRNKLSRPSQ